MFAWHTSPSFGSLALTEKRILDGRRDGACTQSASFREGPQLECAFP